MHALTNDGSDTQSWGVRINTSRKEPWRHDAPPEGCPAWAKPYDVWRWQCYGVVIWDNPFERVDVISFIDAVKLLDQLRASDTWKSEGVVITRTVSYPKHPEQPPAQH